MKTQKVGVMIGIAAMALVTAAGPVRGQAPVIGSFGGNGELVCTNLLAGSTVVVEWASSALGPWTNSWADLAGVTSDSNGVIRVRVPMFYRVRVRGKPMATNPPAPAGMVWIPPGTFVMGSPSSETGRLSEETQHTVTLTKGFYMGKYEVTQGEYVALMGSNPSLFVQIRGYPNSSNRPVERVTWNDAVGYCAALTQRELGAGTLPSGWTYRLPTEAEWEYACRAGTTGAFHSGNAMRSGMANFDGHYEYESTVGDVYNSSGILLDETAVVGSYAPNAWGLYDMHGNVFEWCQDWYGSYPSGSVTDPKGPYAGSPRVFRGGSWNVHAGYCRSAQRNGTMPYGWYSYVGFRVVLAPGQP